MYQGPQPLQLLAPEFTRIHSIATHSESLGPGHGPLGVVSPGLTAEFFMALGPCCLQPYRRPCSEASRFTVERCGPEAAPGAMPVQHDLRRIRLPQVEDTAHRTLQPKSYGTLLRVCANLILFRLQHGLDHFLFHELFRASGGLKRRSTSKTWQQAKLLSKPAFPLS